MQSTTDIEIEGTCATRFAFVRDLLADEFRMGRALGQSVALIVDGELVAHLWAGHADRSRQHRWRAGTMCCLFSAAKPLAALAVLALVGDGTVGLDDRVAEYWPDFAANGKQATTVRHVLAHLAGVPALDVSAPGVVFDADALARAMARQVPTWPPGEQLCFHSFTYGIACAELVRRVTGRSLGRFFRERIARPYELDLAFELDRDEQQNCAEIELVAENALLRMMTDPATPLGQSWRAMDWTQLSSSTFRERGPTSIAAHGSALGLARYYAAMSSDDSTGGRTLLGAAIVREALTEHAHMFDPFMGAPVRMGLGLMLANDVFRFTGPGSFGQPGLGGVVGLGDTQRRLGLGIVCNRLAAGLENPFLDALVAGVVARP
jgi:CubicO group peptidase (beta-lactamase class C family)